MLEQAKRKERRVVVSAATIGDTIIELLYDLATKRTCFAVWNGKRFDIKSAVTLEDRRVLIPYSPTNNLITNNVVLFPATPSEYDSDIFLIQEIQAYIHRYVDVTSRFEKLASYYVLLSWIYDDFNELPFCRLRGDWGSGKTRFLLTVGSVCYKPIFASGASSISAIFRILDAFRGTLILDEGDFRFSDEKADIIKILNQGHVDGIPVLRNELSPTKEYNPRAFQVYGPKIIATRGYFDDRALESRFITEEMGERSIRADIPINLPSNYKEEALDLRNKLLLYRFRNHGKVRNLEQFNDSTLEPRFLQILRPLLSIMEDEELKNDLKLLAREYQNELLIDRGMDIEAQVLESIKEVSEQRGANQLSIKNITNAFYRRSGNPQDRAITMKGMGAIVRKRLRLHTQKSHGVFIIPPNERSKLDFLYKKYDIQ